MRACVRVCALVRMRARAQVDDSSNEGPGETSPYLCSCLIYLRAGPPQNLWLLRRRYAPAAVTT